jgi:hypothetical protein
MSICGNYAKHRWTCALRARDRVCVRCGLPYWDRSEAFFKSPLQQFIPSLSNAMTPKNKISPLKTVALKRLSVQRLTTK